MKKTLLVLAAAVAVMGSTSVMARAEVFGTFDYGDGTTLKIERAAISQGYEWTYTLHHGNTARDPLEFFSVGLQYDDRQGNSVGDINGGRIFTYNSSESTAIASEGQGSAKWFNFTLNPGETAWFSFQTDLTDVGYANHVARDTTYEPMWANRETPVTPEPTGLMAMLTGIGAAAGFWRKRK